jgi:chorismate synthase
MSYNVFGQLLRLSTFGESHGVAVGGILDGFPANVAIDFAAVSNQMQRRRPGQNRLTTPRNESDSVKWLSGFFEGKSTGAPIAFMIENNDARPEDYEKLKDVFRPSHADYTYQMKYGIRDFRGGGRSSARTMAPWVVAGSLAKLLLPQVKITAFVSTIGTVSLPLDYTHLDFSEIENNEVRCPHPQTASAMIEQIEWAIKEKDSLGGIITCVVQNCPFGLGDPQFSKLNALLAHAMFSINAVKGVEFGGGFAMSAKKGSEVNDVFFAENNTIQTQSNFSGGIQGGISNGCDIVFKIAFKPTATIGKPQQTVDTSGEEVMLEASGRHDPCVVPRAAPIVEAMTSLVLADRFLYQITNA